MSRKIEGIREIINSKVMFDNALGNISNIGNLQFLVLSDPKTGSTTVADSIQFALNGTKKKDHVIHMHSDATCLHRLFPKLKEKEVGIKDLVHVRNSVNGSKLKIVTLYREPFSRGISHFFEDLEYRHGIVSEEKGISDFDSLSKLFLENQTGYLWPHHVHWQLKKYFKLDLFGSDYDPATGAGYLQGDKADLIILNLADLNSLEDYVAEKCGLESFCITDSNVSSEKWYSEIYKRMLMEINLPKEVVDQMIWLEQPYLEFFLGSEAHEYICEIYERFGYRYFPFSGSVPKPKMATKSFDNPNYASRLGYLGMKSY